MDESPFAPAHELARETQGRDFEPRAPRCVPRPRRTVERARQRGRHARRRAGARRGRRGRRRSSRAATTSGPLHGLPVTIKDAIETEGIRSTGGAIELTDHVPTADAAVVARLKAAGRDRLRQDQPAALVGRPADLQRDLRHHEQSVGVRPRARRFVGRRRRRGRRRVHRASRSVPTSAARCASRRTAAACSGSSRASASSRSAATSTTSAAARPTPTSTCSDRLRAARDDLDLLLDVLGGPPPEDALSVATRTSARAFSTPLPNSGSACGCSTSDGTVDREYRALLDAAVDRLADEWRVS